MRHPRQLLPGARAPPPGEAPSPKGLGSGHEDGEPGAPDQRSRLPSPPPDLGAPDPATRAPGSASLGPGAAQAYPTGAAMQGSEEDRGEKQERNSPTLPTPLRLPGPLAGTIVDGHAASPSPTWLQRERRPPARAPPPKHASTREKGPALSFLKVCFI